MKKIVPFNNVLTFNTDVYEITAISLEHNLDKEIDSLSGVFYISGEYKILNGGINPEKFNFELPFDIALGTRYDMSSMVVDIDDFRYELIDNNKMKVNIDLYIDGEEVLEEPEELLKEIPVVEKINLTTNDRIEKEIVEEDLNEHCDTTIEDELTKNLSCEKGEIIMDNLEEEILDVKDTMENDIKRESDLMKEIIYTEEEESAENIDINNVVTDNQNNNVLNNLNDEENYVTYKVYRIIEGDTLDSILTKYKVTKEELLNYNENITELKTGDKLIIPFK